MKNNLKYSEIEKSKNIYQSEYQIGEIVYLKTDSDKNARIITAIQFQGNGNIIYLLTLGTTNTWCYDIEMSREKTFLNY